MKIKKIILNGLWVLILLFAFGGTPQKLLADNKANQTGMGASKVPFGPSTERNCINFGDASMLIPYTNGCPSNEGQIKSFANPRCEGEGKDPDISGKSATEYSSGLGRRSSISRCHWNARKTIVNPYWYIFAYDLQVVCACYDFTKPPPYSCTTAQMANPPFPCP